MTPSSSRLYRARCPLSLPLSLSLALALALAVCVPVQSAPSAQWQELLTLDCDGGLRAFASHPVLATGVNASLAHHLYSFAASTVVSRMECACPRLSVEQRTKSYNFEFGNLLSALESGSSDGATAAACSGQDVTVDALGSYFAKYQLPRSCSAANYRQGGACLLAMPLPAFDLTLQLAVQRCPNVAPGATSKLPSIALTCSGRACADLLVPCNTDADCSGSRCTPFSSTTAQQIGDAFESALSSVGLLPPATAPCADTAYMANPGLAMFQAVSQAVGAKLTGGSGVAAHASTGFCGVRAYLPVELFGFSMRIPILSSLVTSLPGYDAFDSLLSTLLSYLPFAPTTEECSFWWPNWYCYETVMGGVSGVGHLLSKALSFFAPLVRDATSSDKFGSDDDGLVRVAAGAVIEWNGKLDDGSDATSVQRRTGAAFFSLASALPTSSLAEDGVTPVSLLSVDCSANMQLLPGQSLSLGVQPPRGFNGLYQQLFAIVQRAQNCGAGATLSAEQASTRFNPLSPEFWLALFGSSSSFTPFPSESSLASLSARLFPSAAADQSDRLTLPASCTWDKYASSGQCSGQWAGLNAIFPGKDLTLRFNLQRCTANPAGLPSLSVQCTGRDCAAMLSMPSQIKACRDDADCSGSSGSCQLLDTEQLDGLFLDMLIDSDRRTAQQLQCDRGAQTAQGAYAALRSAMGVPAAAPTGSRFGLCMLDFQRSVRAEGLDGLELMTHTPGRMTLVDLSRYDAKPVTPDAPSPGKPAKGAATGKAHANAALALALAAIGAALARLSFRL